ncbi:FAD-linked oxidoreductase [Achlya hypogyna]|uniref:FAD-linked oxidoreductase n=1 Tax=Achlya hypogyna TaxID=1202772 RepID=A0A1V9YZH2_ACHHY|nr:FAD-linked oxidoreductase [Achlya hypogyna]
MVRSWLAAVAVAAATSVAAETWTNWDTRQVCHPSAHLRPSSLSELQAIVADATSLRVAGAGHSFSPIVLTNATLVTLENYASLVELTEDTVTVQAGMPLHEINDLLASHGRALPNVGAVAVQTAAGATSTGTHGTGDTGSLSANIVAMEIVVANGSVVHINRGGLLNAARVAMGTLGVVSTITFAHVPLWTMEQITFTMPYDEFTYDLRKLQAAFPRLQWYMADLPASKTVTVLLRVNTTAPVTTGCWNGTFANVPVTPPPLGWSAWPDSTKACVDVSYKTLGRVGENNTKLFTEMEMMIPAARDLDGLERMLELHASLAPSHDPSVSLFLGVRYVEADTIWLSPFYGRHTAVFSTIIYSGPAAVTNELKAYHHGMQSVLASNFGARPHPGKVNYFDAAMMRKVYPRFDDFVALQQAWDPTGKFLNDYTTRLLVLPPSSWPLVLPLAVLGGIILVGIGSVYLQQTRRKAGYQSVA